MLLIPIDSGYTVEYDFDTNVLKNDTQNEVSLKKISLRSRNESHNS